MTTIALAIGLIVANIVQPGAGMNIDAAAIDTKDIAGFVAKSKDQSTIAFLLDIIPSTLFGAIAEGNILQVLLVAILFAFGLQALGKKGEPLLNLIDQVAHVLFKIVGFIMRFAPIGAFGAMAFTIGKYGLGSLKSLALLMGSFYLDLPAVHVRRAGLDRVVEWLFDFPVHRLHQGRAADRARHVVV